VSDTGIGIPGDRLDCLFQSFNQVDASTTRKYGGTGLGLAISKRLITLMGGDIGVESEGVPGLGSTFHFTILADLVDDQLCAAQHVDALAGKRLLIIEPNQTNRRILAEFASSWGMIAGAASTVEGLALIRHGTLFDAAIMNMQWYDSVRVALARELQELKPLPLIALTYVGRGIRDADKDLFAAQLTIPIKSSQLFQVLNNVLGSQPAPAGSQASRSGTGRKMAEQLPLSILLAEDNIINQKVAQHILGRLGYFPDLAADGVEVLDALSRQSYDVVLMDMHMPKMDGMEATRIIRERFPPSQQPAIIAVTADAMQGDRERCLAAGVDNYLSKPIGIKELSAILAQTAAQHSRIRMKTAVGLP